MANVGNTRLNNSITDKQCNYAAQSYSGVCDSYEPHSNCLTMYAMYYILHSNIYDQCSGLSK